MPAVAFVINSTLARASGTFFALCRGAAVKAGWKPELVLTDKAGEGVTAAREAAADGTDLVVAVGGDGTVRGCAEALADTGVPLGIVPLGTGNLLARTIGIPSHPGEALDVALAPEAAVRSSGVGYSHGARHTHRGRRPHGAGPARAATRQIDLATADGAPFTAMAGMGLDAAVVAATRLKHQFGWLAYALSGAAHLADPPARFTIKMDDGPPIVRTARSVVVGNSGLLPGGFALLPDARLDDGLLDVAVLAPHGPFGWPRLATRVLTNSRVQDRQLERLQARTVEITAETPLPREVDGEVVTPARTLTVAVRPAALTVRVPDAAAARS
jgi:diacylglycerol kinase family enzyme